MKWFLRALLVALALVPFGRTATADPVNLLFDIIGPTRSGAMINALEPWAAKVNQEGAGIIHVDVREGVTLATFENIYDRVLDDAIQVGWGMQNAVAGKFPLSEVPAVPFLVKSAQAGSVAFWRLYKTGLLDSEYDQIVPLATGMLGAGGLHINAPLKSFADLNGLKLIVAGQMQSKTIAALGASPISIPLTDEYQAVQRKTADGVVIGWGGVRAFKLEQVAPYHVDVTVGTSISMVFMAKKKFDALPAAAQKILLDTSGEALSRQYGIAVDNEAAGIRDAVMAENGQKTVTVPAADMAKWEAKVKPVVDQWAASRKNGQAVLDKYRTLYAQAAAEIRQH
ncbi:MAG TPA: TRAP transporter substrate-binding protein [Stellaceae bacterium]|jgi:TRAP-type C4-dicarboxylate transport system substrate-binding protein